MEEVWKSEKASWLYVLELILFHLLITYIPFKVIGAGYAALFSSSATRKQGTMLTIPTPGPSLGVQGEEEERLNSASEGQSLRLHVT